MSLRHNNPKAWQELLTIIAESVVREIFKETEPSLTSEELIQLTGYKRASKQIQWLQERDWIFEISDSGKPSVDRTYYLEKMDAGNSRT